MFPDPTGRAKKTSAKGQETDHTILKRVGDHVWFRLASTP